MEGVPSIGYLLAFNNNAHVRDPLTLAQSLDQGKTWNILQDIEPSPGNFEYPAIIQSKINNNVAHTCYTYTGPRSNNNRVMAYAKITF
jgi:predicted neuraminidase